VIASAARSSSEGQKDSWSLWRAVKPIELDQVSEKAQNGLNENDPHTLSVSLHGDKFSV